MKRCTKCGEDKPFDCFYKTTRTTSGLIGHCKDCDRIYRKEQSTKRLAYEKQWRAINPGRYKGRKKAKNKKDKDELANWYVAALLKQGLGVQRAPQELVNLKREQLILRRLATTLKQAAKESNESSN